ncbi:hypothetical protein N9043_01135 [bacterium]|nr:hypothetical protein [bacterium]
MKDTFGNYNFAIGNNNYHIQRMGWRVQRDFIGVLREALDDDGNMIPFSDGFNKAQDWLLPIVMHVDDRGAKNPLTDEYLDAHLETSPTTPFDLANEIFMEGVKILSENFTQSDSPPTSSNQDAEMSSKSPNSQNKLSKTLNK